MYTTIEINVSAEQYSPAAATFKLNIQTEADDVYNLAKVIDDGFRAAVEKAKQQLTPPTGIETPLP